jgi:RNA polymerase sigma-70 factor, ECF subfamily
MEDWAKGSRQRSSGRNFPLIAVFLSTAVRLFLWRAGVTVSCARYEANLIARAAQSDAAAVRAIMRLCNRRLFRIARSVAGNDQEAEDVMQAAYGLAFTHLCKFRADCKICTWLARIVLNEALGRRRKPDTVGHISLDDHQRARSLPLADKQPDPERMVAQREIHRLLERAIDNLPRGFRMVLVMRTLEGMSIEETASLLGIRPQTVKTRLHRARALLRARLEKDVGPLLTDAFPFEGERCMSLTARVISRLKLRGGIKPRSFLSQPA